MKSSRFLSIITLLVLGLGSKQAMAQKAWATPDPINQNDSITLWVDLKKCEFAGVPNMLGATQPMYMWTWSPKEHPAGHPLNNGKWNESNEALRWIHAGDDVYYFRMIPTQFYEVSAGDLYAKDISLLLKFKDGSTGANGSECKTEDLKIDFTAPVTGPEKVACFPSKKIKDTLSISGNDVFTIIYNNKIEDKDSLKNKEDFYVFIKARTGANSFITVASNEKTTGNFDKLAMKNMGDGKFKFSIMPNKFFAPYNPTNAKILSLQVRIVRKKVSNQNDMVEGPDPALQFGGFYEYWLNTNCE